MCQLLAIPFGLPVRQGVRSGVLAGHFCCTAVGWAVTFDVYIYVISTVVGCSVKFLFLFFVGQLSLLQVFGMSHLVLSSAIMFVQQIIGVQHLVSQACFHQFVGVFTSKVSYI